MKGSETKPVVALVWTQFSPYHIDRCEAVAERLGTSADVLACEIATRSATYAWDPSGEITGARKITLFPGQSYDDVPWPRRLLRLRSALRGASYVFIGVSYAAPEVVLLSAWLRLAGKRVIMMTESKFDDRTRWILTEMLKAAALSIYSGALVGGRRQREYVRFLGFRKRPVVEGYDCVGLERVRRMTEQKPAPEGLDFRDRSFVFVARLVEKKNVLVLLDAYAQYLQSPGATGRKLILVGGGELESAVRARVDKLRIADKVVLPGFVQADGVASSLAQGLAFILPSTEEQWGLVVNEALAFNLPIIVSENVGARDNLVANLLNGFVVASDSIDGFARAMLLLDTDEDMWRKMVAESARRSYAADTPRFAEGVEHHLTLTAKEPVTVGAAVSGPLDPRTNNFVQVDTSASRKSKKS